MNHFDNNGWTSIHWAAYKGHDTALESFMKRDIEKIELLTQDELHSTPLLLATMAGNIETVKLLVGFGAQIHARNSQGHGIIEISCLRRDMDMLKYFLYNVRDDELPVWVQLVDFVGSLDDEESLRAIHCVEQLVKETVVGEGEKMSDCHTKLVESGIVDIIIKVVKGSQGYECKRQSLIILMHFIHNQAIRDDFIKSEGLDPLLPLLRPPSNPDTSNIVIQVLNALIMEPNGYSENVFRSKVITDINRILQWATQSSDENERKQTDKDLDSSKEADSQLPSKEEWIAPDLLEQIIFFIGNLVEIHQTYQNEIGREHGLIGRLTSLFSACKKRTMMLSLAACVTKLSNHNQTNQNLFMKERVDDCLIPLLRAKDQAIQMAALKAIYQLSECNKENQSILMAKECYKPILLILKKAGRNLEINENASTALWCLAGDTREKKTIMADYIGVDKLIDFLQMASVNLQFIGSEGIYVLSGGPTSQRDVIGKKNGIAPLVKLLSSNEKEIVLSCIRSLRQLCVRLGYLPHVRNQQIVLITRGLQVLVDLMRFCEDDLVKMEAAYTIACVAMRNDEAITELHVNPKFNYVYILEKVYKEIVKVRLLAGAALATFAYNNLVEQKQIAMCGGIRFNCLKQFLFSDDEYERCMIAFQLVTLARVIPDEELANSTAWGVKTLIETLGHTKNSEVQEFGCDCVARLCHTRAGVAAGMVSLGVVDILCSLMLSYNESVRGTAAIAIQYLSHYPESRRQILRKCRRDPYLMKAIQFYNSSDSIDVNFTEVWRHYQRVGLPKIDKTRPPLTERKETSPLKNYDAKQYTLFSDATDLVDNAPNTSRSVLPKLPPIEKPSKTDLDDEINEAEENQAADDMNDDLMRKVSFHFEETQLSIA